MKKILITGALGQIGTELTQALYRQYGKENVIATDIRKPDGDLAIHGPFEILDAQDGKKLQAVARRHGVDTIIHLAALLSATAEKKPLVAWNLNMNSLLNALEVARELKLKLFFPSSIGAFGPNTPPVNTPQDTIQRPTSIYGITKVTGELLADYYYYKYGVDTRGLRFPGLISHEAPPGGGTTDYAVEMYYAAIRKKRYTSYIAEGTYLDMMYMDDAVQAIIQLMEADPARLIHRNAFNVSAMSVAPETIAAEIRKHIPEFQLDYDVDPIRQKIAESWPDSLDTTAAEVEWGFEPRYDLAKMTEVMLEKLQQKIA